MQIPHAGGTYRRIAAVAGCTFLACALLCLGLMLGGYWAVALVMGGYKAGPQLARFWTGGLLAAGLGGALLVTALHWPVARS